MRSQGFVVVNREGYGYPVTRRVVGIGKKDQRTRSLVCLVLSGLHSSVM